MKNDNKFQIIIGIELDLEKLDLQKEVKIGLIFLMELPGNETLKS